MRIGCFLFFSGPALLLLACSATETAPGGPPDRLRAGASAYRICYHCHSLQPGVHLTGPSLAGIWNRKSGTVAGYEFGSPALRKAALRWNRETLRRWLEKPGALVPGNHMSFEGIPDPETREALVDFLQLALAERGRLRVLELQLLDRETAEGQLPKDLSGSADRVRRLEYCDGAYTVLTDDGATTRYWEQNILLKVVEGARGPGGGLAVRTGVNSMGDRAAIVFSSVAQLKAALRPCRKRQPADTFPASRKR